MPETKYLEYENILPSLLCLFEIDSRLLTWAVGFKSHMDWDKREDTSSTTICWKSKSMKQKQWLKSSGGQQNQYVAIFSVYDEQGMSKIKHNNDKTDFFRVGVSLFIDYFFQSASVF